MLYIANKDIKRVKEEFDKLEPWEKNDLICTILENDSNLYNAVKDTVYPDYTKDEGYYDDGDDYEDDEDKLRYVLDTFDPEYVMDQYDLGEVADYVLYREDVFKDIVKQMGVKKALKCML